MRAVEELSRHGVTAGVMASPVLPGLNDSPRSLEAVARAAAAAGAKRFSAQVLFLKPAAARVFLPWVGREFPALARAYQEHFARSAFLRGAYPARIRDLVSRLREKYGLSPHSASQQAPWQIPLFAIGADQPLESDTRNGCGR